MDALSTERVAEAPLRRPGGFSQTLTRLFTKPARVVQCETLADGFRLLTLESAQFQGLAWVPGQKVQILMGSAFASRTFTPMDWDAAMGRTRILGFVHGDGPGSAWVRDAQPGDSCDVFGPRASLDVRGPAGPVALFGDETSLGLAHALARARPGQAVHALLEVDAAAPVRQVLAALDLGGAELFERQPDDGQLAQVERRLRTLAAAGASFVLTGKAPSIQRLRRGLKTLGVPAGQLATKAYWAPGKAGLD